MNTIRTVTPVPESCVDCAHHEVQSDPDPHDWFCHDDVRVVCKMGGFNCAVACRPYQTRRETTPPPPRCPLREVSV